MTIKKIDVYFRVKILLVWQQLWTPFHDPSKPCEYYNDLQRATMERIFKIRKDILIFKRIW